MVRCRISSPILHVRVNFSTTVHVRFDHTNGFITTLSSNRGWAFIHAHGQTKHTNTHKVSFLILLQCPPLNFLNSVNQHTHSAVEDFKKGTRKNTKVCFGKGEKDALEKESLDLNWIPSSYTVISSCYVRNPFYIN